MVADGLLQFANNWPDVPVMKADALSTTKAVPLPTNGTSQSLQNGTSLAAKLEAQVDVVMKENVKP